MKALEQLIHDPAAGIDDIAAHLDGLDHQARLRALAKTTRAVQRVLWRKAGDAPPITLEHFLPERAGPLEPVVHHGRNTLPLPPKHRFFRKVMARPDDGSARAFGYNDAPSGRLVGPGYFVVVSTEGHPAWQERGAWVVDYFQHPDGAVPDGWPRVRSNKKGLQRLVYHGTRDFMRRVSEHVSIGAAFKGDMALGHYFTLCRED